MIEMLDPTQPWDIPLPTSWEDPERLLEARYGAMPVMTWQWTSGYEWPWRIVADLSNGRKLGQHYHYPDIVALCMANGYTLALPPRRPGRARERDRRPRTGGLSDG